MHFRLRNKSRVPAINVTSLIDVLFLLVIFVLLAAKFEPEAGIHVDLPKGKSREVDKNQPIQLMISPEGAFFLGKDPVAPEALTQAIRAARDGKDDPVLMIFADRRVAWEKVVQATDAAKDAGQQKINFKIRH